MKLFFAITGLLVLTCITGAESFAGSSETLNQNTTVMDYSLIPDQPTELQIRLIYLLPSTIDALFHDSSIRVHLRELIPDRKNGALQVIVSVLEDGLFSTQNFKFIQDGISYGIGLEDIVKISENFRKVGAIIAGTLESGVVFIPSGLDLTKPIDVLYNNLESRTRLRISKPVEPVKIVTESSHLDSLRALRDSLIKRLQSVQESIDSLEAAK